MDYTPFLIHSPTTVGNSGGKTSGYNLWLHLQANGGELTPNGRCVFTNTGWEHPLTLDFLCEQERRWQCPIAWLEFTRRTATVGELSRLEIKWQSAQDRLARLWSEPLSFFSPKRKTRKPGVLFNASPEDLRREVLRKAKRYADDCFHSYRKAELIGTDTYRRVTRETASVNGEPFTELLDGLFRFRTQVKSEPGVLPNGVQRICTGHLKVRITSRFASDEWKIAKNAFECRLGLRADEEPRVLSAKEWGRDGGKAMFPLYEAGVEKEDVAAFWKKQPFGLSLKAHEGNCGLCHMKRREALLNLIRRGFADLDWWKEWEIRTGQRFRAERSYRSLEIAAASEQMLFEVDDLDNAITCDTGYCSN